jgi:regulator of sigma E protease
VENFFTFLPNYVVPFIIVLGILVFVHEFGHYIIARINGVRVLDFSIGFGPELFGWQDSHGTRWKVCLAPLGGYVRMFGDMDPASAKNIEDDEEIELTEKEKEQAFFTQPVGKRAAIVAAGPLINVLFAVLLYMGLFMAVGQPYAPTIVGGVVEDTAAARAGLQPDDKIMAINGQSVNKFQDLQRFVRLNMGKEIAITINRDDQTKTLTAVPEVVTQEDRFGFKHKFGRLGIVSVGEVDMRRLGPGQATIAAFKETWEITAGTFKGLWQMVTGVRGVEELGGILRIGILAGEFAESGLASAIDFTALLSINLALINLFPIPLLDGGHLLFYGMEALRGRPVNEAVQEVAYRIGFSLIIGLMVLATWNDLVQLEFFSFVKGLFA